MQSSNSEPTNPLGLNLDFMFGRGYLWANRERISDWITLEKLRMEIPDLAFPFDARGGLDRFRNTRCLVREIELGISEVGLGDLLRQAAAQLERFQDLQVRFLADAVHISVRVQAMGADAYVSFRAALIPPEPARVDEIHLSLYDYRAYGPLPFPARLVAFELMTGLLNTELLRPPGRGQSFTVGVAGDILSFRPLKLILLHIFAHAGWKLPNLSDVLLDGARIRPGLLTIRAGTRDADWRMAHAHSAGDPRDEFQLTQTREGARALGAYEAKDLFVHADQALFDGQMRQAMETLSGYRDVYGLHSELVSRTLDCLLAAPSPAHLAEAEAICRQLEAEHRADLRAQLARPTLAMLAPARGDQRAQVIAAFERLAKTLQARGDTPDWILAQLSLAEHLSAHRPEDACARLREILRVSPRNRIALEKLRALYTRLDDATGLEEVLKRLTGVYTERDALKNTYLELANLLMARDAARRADAHESATSAGDELRESRIYLEKVLRLDPAELGALHTLAESYVRGAQPLRALKTFGSAARAAEASGDSRTAARLLYRVARLWSEELHDLEQALMSCRRALALRQEDADVLELAAQLCTQREQLAEATDYWLLAIPLLEQEVERVEHLAPGSSEQVAEDAPTHRSAKARLVDAHRQIAQLYQQRGRDAAAQTHVQRAQEIDPHAGIFDLPAAPEPTPVAEPTPIISFSQDDTPSAARQNAVTRKMVAPTPEQIAADKSKSEAPAPPPAQVPSLDDFRARYRELFLAKKAERSAPKPAQGPERAPEQPAEASDSAAEALLREHIAQARAQDSPALLADALSELIAAHLDADDAVDLEQAELMRLSMELGELYYYDLEDVQAARIHLERVRDEDPDGLGSQPTLLTTLEAIYEESGALSERIRILNARLKNADSAEMRITYRLIIAQLIWDEKPDALDDPGDAQADAHARAEQARPWLQEVLKADPQNEAAHRLLGQIAYALQDYERAVRHYKAVLKVAGGGLDAIEMERDLGRVLLDKLGQADAAKQHFENVLTAAPGDSMALDGIKQCQAATQDWGGYVESLGRELGLLIGQPQGLSAQEMAQLEAEQIRAALRVPASQIVADAAHIVEHDLGDLQGAWALWGKAFALWPEHVDALERRVALDRTLDKSEALAQDLESYAELLLDPHARFETLNEAATLYANTLGRPDLARPVFAEAIALVQDEAQPPAGLDPARRALRALQSDSKS